MEQDQGARGAGREPIPPWVALETGEADTPHGWEPKHLSVVVQKPQSHTRV